MIDQPAADTVLSAVSLRLGALARSPSNQAIDDGVRYELRVLSNLASILARELAEGSSLDASTRQELRAAAEVLGANAGDPQADESVLEVASTIDQMVGDATIQRGSLDDQVGPIDSRHRRKLFHDHLLRAVESRLDIQRPDYRHSA